MKPLAAEAARIFPPAQVTYEWIPREQNKHADRLANEAMDAGKRGEQWEPSALDGGAGRARRRTRRGVGRRRRGGAARRGAAEAGAARPPASPAAGPVRAGRRQPARRRRTVGWGAADLGAPATFVLLRHGETAAHPREAVLGQRRQRPRAVRGRPRARPSAVAAALAARGTIQDDRQLPAAPLPRDRRGRRRPARPGRPHRGRPARDGLRRLGGADLRRGARALPATT